MLEEDILVIPDRYTLAHYVLYRIRISNLPGRVIDENDGVSLIQFTKEAEDRIIRFVEICAELWNKNHEDKLTFAQLYEMYSAMANRDVLDVQKTGMVSP